MLEASDPAGLPVKVRFEGSVLVPVAPPAAFAIADMSSLSKWNRDWIQFTPEGEGTRLTFRNESSLPRWARPLRWVISTAFHRQAQRSVDGAARYLAEGNHI